MTRAASRSELTWAWACTKTRSRSIRPPTIAVTRAGMRMAMEKSLIRRDWMLDLRFRGDAGSPLHARNFATELRNTPDLAKIRCGILSQTPLRQKAQQCSLDYRPVYL